MSKKETHTKLKETVLLEDRLTDIELSRDALIERLNNINHQIQVLDHQRKELAMAITKLNGQVELLNLMMHDDTPT